MSHCVTDMLTSQNFFGLDKHFLVEENITSSRGRHRHRYPDVTALSFYEFTLPTCQSLIWIF